jgi:hypothetical protein
MQKKIKQQKAFNNRLHKGPQKAGGLGNNNFIIKRTSSIVRIPFVACEAERKADRLRCARIIK